MHVKTGLKVTWHIKRFLDYPAVDTLLTFENTSGGNDTALVEDVQNVHLKMNHSQPGKTYTVHGAHGGRCGLDDLMPFSRAVPIVSNRSKPSLKLLKKDDLVNAPSDILQFGSQGSSSNNDCRFLTSRLPRIAAFWLVSAGPEIGRPNSREPTLNWTPRPA